MSRNAHASMGMREARTEGFGPYIGGRADNGSMRNFGDNVGIATPTAYGDSGEVRWEAHLLDSDTDGPMSDRDAADRAYEDAKRDDFGGIRGANRSRREQFHSSNLNQRFNREGFRTQKRAEIAVSAYKKRLDDGRDVDTGKYEED